MRPVSLWLGMGAEHRLRAMRSIDVPEPEKYVGLAWNNLPKYLQELFADFVKTDDEIQRQFVQDDPTDVELEGYGGWPYPW